METELFHADGRKNSDMTKLIVAFRNSANAVDKTEPISMLLFRGTEKNAGPNLKNILRVVRYAKAKFCLRVTLRLLGSVSIVTCMIGHPFFLHNLLPSDSL